MINWQLAVVKKTAKDVIEDVESKIGTRMKKTIDYFNGHFAAMGPLLESTISIIRQLHTELHIYIFDIFTSYVCVDIFTLDVLIQ